MAFNIGVFELEKLEKYRRVFSDECNYENLSIMRLMQGYRLDEKTFNLDRDVDYIYHKCFDTVLYNYHNNGIVPPILTYGVVDSSELKTKDCKYAHSIKPVTIHCGVYTDGSKYSPFEDNILVSLNTDFFRKSNIKHTKNDLTALKNELTEEKVKATIYHELSHWVSDVKYNNYLYKLIKRAYSIPSNMPNRVKKMIKILDMGKSNTRVTTYEIDAQIHGIKQIKRLNTDKWDDLELVDLFFKYPVLRNIAMELINIDYQIYIEWVKDIIKRLQRENLLGKNMRSIPSKKMIEEIEIKELFRI